jgi:dihydroorotate dehydrogenase electron transfer subunit
MAIERARPGPISHFAQVLLTDVPFACGVGACMSCAVEGERGLRLACIDGPVFDLKDLEGALGQ